MKRRPIRRKIQRVVLLISIIALVIAAAVGMISMLNLRANVLYSGSDLGDTVAADSTQALQCQMEQSLLDLVSSKASLADAKLEKYSRYVNLFSLYVQKLYANPDSVLSVEVLPPDAANKDVLTMQRNLADESIVYSDVAAEIQLLGNTEKVFAPVIQEEQDVISAIYLGTESGFLLSYDIHSDTADTGDGGEEVYYDYFTSDWYTSAKGEDGLIFTDTFQDEYKQSLAIRCAAPFYKADNSLAGVVCMDILLPDLTQNIIGMGTAEGSSAFLLNQKGDIIASPDMSGDTQEYVNVTDADFAAQDVSTQLMSGDTGFVQSENGNYYAYTPITTTNWTLVICVPAETITASVDSIQTGIQESTTNTAQNMDRSILLAILILAAALIVMVVVVILLSRHFARRLTTPLTALQEDVEEISSGNLEHQATVTTNDEISDLAVSFNSMTDSLRQYITDLTAVTAEKERTGAQLNVAAQIQASMLPCMFPALPEHQNFDIYATMYPAREVGGDFYDFFMVDEHHLAVVIADVSGKGVPAALFMVIGKTLIKDHTQPGADLGKVLTEVNNLLCQSNNEGLFIATFEGVIDLRTGELTFVNAGHKSPFIRKANSCYEMQVIPSSYVLAGQEGTQYETGKIILAPGDALYLYTNGVTEATNGSNKQYGIERLTAALNSYLTLKPAELLPAIKADIDAFAEGTPQSDDITMLCLEYKEQI